MSFPKGRDPQNDLFKAEFFAALNGKGWKLVLPDFLPLQRDLRAVAEAYLSAALKAPLGLADGAPSRTNNQRLRELQGHVLGPARRLLATLEIQNNPILSEFPDDMVGREPNKAALMKELRALVARASGIEANLNDRPGSHARKELQHELANALADIFEKHFPALPPRRHYEERWPTRDGRPGKSLQPEYELSAFVRLCTKEIFPRDNLFVREVLDDIIKSRHG